MSKQAQTTATATTTPAPRTYHGAGDEAKRLSTSERWLFYRVADGTIPCVRVAGRTLFDPCAVDAALAKFAVNSPRPPKRRAGRLAEPIAS